MKLNRLALAACFAFAVVGAQAQTISLTGTIDLSDPVFNRPVSLTSLSGVGTAVHYDAFSFFATSSGPYTFTMVSGPAPSTFDTFLALYTGVFSAATPLTGLVALNDDLGGTSLTSSGFNYALTAGSIYTVVSTAFANTGVGSYTTTIAATVVPEPGSYVLMFAGLVGIGLTLNRRRSSQSHSVS